MWPDDRFPMKVFNLQCALGHDFEGWFGSDADLAGQRERGLLTCPLCGDTQVQKMPSAPRLNLRTSDPGGVGAARPGGGETSNAVELMAPDRPTHGRLLQALRQLMAQTEDVGERFPEQALAMHHGEVEQRNIRGRATPEQALELIEEGVDILPLPPLVAVKETLH